MTSPRPGAARSRRRGGRRDPRPGTQPLEARGHAEQQPLRTRRPDELDADPQPGARVHASRARRPPGTRRGSTRPGTRRCDSTFAATFAAHDRSLQRVRAQRAGSRAPASRGRRTGEKNSSACSRHASACAGRTRRRARRPTAACCRVRGSRSPSASSAGLVGGGGEPPRGDSRTGRERVARPGPLDPGAGLAQRGGGGERRAHHLGRDRHPGDGRRHRAGDPQARPRVPRPGPAPGRRPAPTSISAASVDRRRQDAVLAEPEPLPGAEVRPARSRRGRA